MERRNGREEGMHGSQLVLDKSLGRIKGNEAGETRAKTRFEKICVLILPPPQNKPVALGRVTSSRRASVCSVLRRKKG